MNKTKKINLIENYTQSLAELNRSVDQAQLIVLSSYQELLNDIFQEPVQAVGIKGIAQNLSNIFSRKKPPQVQNNWRGLYVWGSVGRGKTYLMDLFFDALDTDGQIAASRYHYHYFMQMIHQKLAKIKDQQNPLDLIAADIAASTKVLCLDEFFVVDITDAMLLARLIESLFNKGVYLVTTSNCAPDELYKNGLQRERFLAAIKLIKLRMLIVSLDSPTDYRLRHLEQEKVWKILEDKSDKQNIGYLFLADLFMHINAHTGAGAQTISLNGRDLSVIDRGTHTLFCEFKVLCVENRGAIDYIELAKIYHTILIANIPQFDEFSENEARRFISMIDTFYDAGVKIAATALCNIQDIYQGNLLDFEFQRTISRLIEMQSLEYLKKDHQHHHQEDQQELK